MIGQRLILFNLDLNRLLTDNQLFPFLAHMMQQKLLLILWQYIMENMNKLIRINSLGISHGLELLTDALVLFLGPFQVLVVGLVHN